jgi:hypothetical protein
MTLGSNQPLTENEYQEYFLWGGGEVKAADA